MSPARRSWPSGRRSGCSRLHNVAHDQAGCHGGHRGRSPSTGVTPGGQMRDSPRPRPPFGHPLIGAGGGGGGAPLTRPTATRAKKRLSMVEWIVGGCRRAVAGLVLTVRATLDFVPKASKANHDPRGERIIVIREASAVVGHGLSRKERSTVRAIDLDDRFRRQARRTDERRR
jgi:hypothetical protein